MSPKLHYIIGDATEPIKKPAIIAHVCNDCVPNAWGAGFVVALSKKNRNPEKACKRWAADGYKDYALGAVQFVHFEEGVLVANMIGQHGIGRNNGIPPVRYEAIERCLKSVQQHALFTDRTVHMPRIGAGLAGGDWKKIEGIIQGTLQVDTYVYTLSSEMNNWSEMYENAGDFE